MSRALILAAILCFSPQSPVQPTSVLHIKVILADAEGKPAPVPRHALLISDNPSTAPPRRIVTTLNGTADVQLRPGNYTVESDEPVAFLGKRYQWTQMIDIAAGRDAALELTAANAEIDAIAAAIDGAADPASLLTAWQSSVVAVWTPTTHASGFVIDERGLIVTNRGGIGAEATVEVQITRAMKLAARVLATDPVRDVAVLWIDPAAAGARPIPLRCEASKPVLSTGQPILTIGTPLLGPKDLISGTVAAQDPLGPHAELALPAGSAGGPVFTGQGDVAGMTSISADNGGSGTAAGEDSRVVTTEAICRLVAVAAKRITDGIRPSGTLLPVEPEKAFPVDALKEAAQHRAGSLNPYQLSASDFDIAFITPVALYAAQYQQELARDRDRARTNRVPDADPAFVRPLMEFGNWSEYINELPSVLLVRVTPKLVEGFWMKVARGAAQTQGVALPPIKRFTSGFSRLRAFCGDAPVTPIHAFKLEHRIGEREAIYEGLYVFDPGALAPRCGGVKLEVYSEKSPQKADTRVVDPKVVEQIWTDFALFRDAR